MKNLIGWLVLVSIIAAPIYAWFYPTLISAFFAGMAMMTWLNIATSLTINQEGSSNE